MFSWGEDICRGFGLKTNAAKLENGVNFLNLRSQIEDVSVGHRVVAFIKGDGKLFVIRCHENQDGTRVTGKLKCVGCKEKFRAVSCSDDSAVLLSEEGKVLFLNRAYTPRPVEIFRNIHVSQVACGNQHSLALTKDGQVYTWGQDCSGQLGLGKGTASVCSPQHLKSLSAVPLVQITAGGHQSFALSFSGAVFVWGRNNSGQLGLGDTTDRHMPTPVHCLNMKNTIYVSCGENHTAILTKDGTVFTFGSSQYGQLGHNSFRDELRPRVVAELWGAKVTKIACGRHHTLVLTESKRVHSFGCRDQGQLGHREGSNQSVPLPVQLSQDSLPGQDIAHIYAGGNCSFAVCPSDQDFHNNLKVNNVTQQPLDNMIDHWISESNPKPWKIIKKDINRMFSSASCVNQSFLDRSNDKHCCTSPKYSGLKLSLARLSFKKLVKRDNVLAKVEDVVMQSLLPSLDERPVGLEGLRVYLLLTELLRVLQKHRQQESIQVTVAVAAAMLKLPPESLQVLGSWWSSLKPSTKVKHVQVWKQTLKHILTTRLTRDHPGDQSEIKALLQVLDHLYRANNKIAGPERIATSIFCLEEIIFDRSFLMTDLKLWRSRPNQEDANEMPPVLCHFPFLMDLRCKVMIFDISVQNTQAQHQRNQMYPFGTQSSADRFFELRLRRASLLEETFEQLRETYHTTFKKPLAVYFDEDSKLTNVHKGDFFLHLFDELISPESEMFTYNDSKTLAWFPTKATAGVNRYFLLGVLCGLAIYNQNVIHFPFPLALFKKLLNVEPSLEDLIEFSPEVGKSLRYILEEYEDNDLENLDMDFSVVWDGIAVELDPQTPGKPVTSQNKKDFVDAYLNHVFHASVEQVFADFRRGFFTVCDQDVVELFWPEELKGLMVGKENYDWGKLKQNTVYEYEYHPCHPNIVVFWEVFEELTEDQKRAFLLFLTGSDRVPILGMDQIRMRVRVLYNSSQQHFPEALTCHSILDLPLYSTKERLRARLMEALHHSRGFLK
ncbi:putative E3 ubiquitin-protein ligase HERC3 [Polymixia lowei]